MPIVIITLSKSQPPKVVLDHEYYIERLYCCLPASAILSLRMYLKRTHQGTIFSTPS